MTEERTMPLLGAGSIDLAAVHAADARGHDLDKAIDKARTTVEPAKDKPKHKRELLLEDAAKAGIELRDGATSIEIRKALAEHAAKPKAKPAADTAAGATD